MKLPITKIRPEAQLPEYKTKGSVGFDLAASETVTIQPKTIAMIPTGLVTKVPDGHMLMVCSRSSTPMKKGLTPPHGVGILDQDYCGPNDEIKILTYNFLDTPVTVEKGERIAQGVIVKIEQCEIVDSPITTQDDRGGFGSTGVN